MYAHAYTCTHVHTQLGTLFRRYAVTYPRLGMTEEELQTILIQEFHVSCYVYVVMFVPVPGYH